MLSTDTLRKSDWEVWPVRIDEARRIIEKYHYAHGASNTAVAIHGLYRVGEILAPKCYGVTWWIPPTRVAAASCWHDPEEVLSLSRMVILPEAPKNAATFLLMRSVKMLEPRWKCLVTYADTWQGHTGHIYRAAGWEYMGMTKPKAVFIFNGRMVATKAGPKTRRHSEMLAMGAELVGRYPKHKFRYIRDRKMRNREGMG